MDINSHFRSATQLPSDCMGSVTCHKPITVWFSIFFDGTGNNLEIDETTGSMSNIAKLYKSHKFMPENGVIPIYINGVGTRRDDLGPLEYMRDSIVVGGGLGAGGHSRILEAKNKLVKSLESQKHVTTINIAIFGFSRGAALARYFANVVVNDGIENPATPSMPFTVGQNVNLKFLGIFDTVGSFGIGGNNIDWGYTFEIPEAVERTVHYIAAHERRSKFDLQSIRRDGYSPVSGRLKEVIYPGMHADVGGGYAQGDQGRSKELSRIPLNHMLKEAINAGVPFIEKGNLKIIAADIYALFEVGRSLQRFYDLYCSQVPAHTNLYQSIAAHERLYFKWLKNQITLPGEFQNTIDKLTANKNRLIEETAPISKKEREKRVETFKKLQRAQRHAPRKHTGVQLWAGIYDDAAYLEVYRALLGNHDKIEAIEGVIDDMQSYHSQLKDSYYSAKWRDLYSKGIQPSFNPPASAFYSSPPSEHQQKGAQKRIKPMRDEERDFLAWMDAPMPLAKEVSLLFERYIHDSVAHTPDPTGDRYFQRRAIFFQNDERWISEERT